MARSNKLEVKEPNPKVPQITLAPKLEEIAPYQITDPTAYVCPLHVVDHEVQTRSKSQKRKLEEQELGLTDLPMADISDLPQRVKARIRPRSGEPFTKQLRSKIIEATQNDQQYEETEPDTVPDNNNESAKLIPKGKTLVATINGTIVKVDPTIRNHRTSNFDLLKHKMKQLIKDVLHKLEIKPSWRSVQKSDGPCMNGPEVGSNERRAPHSATCKRWRKETRKERKQEQKNVMSTNSNKVTSTIDKLASTASPFCARVQINGIALTGLFDTGSQISIMSPDTAEFLYVPVQEDHTCDAPVSTGDWKRLGR